MQRVWGGNKFPPFTAEVCMLNILFEEGRYCFGDEGMSSCDQDLLVYLAKDPNLYFDLLVNAYSQAQVENDTHQIKQRSSDQYYLEILRRAVTERDEKAWTLLQQQFAEDIRLWLERHLYREAALNCDTEQNYIDDTFRRFWQAVNDQQLAFSTRASMLSYLRLCLNCTVMDALRAYSRTRLKEVSTYSEFDKPGTDVFSKSEVWKMIVNLLHNEKEKRLAYLLFQCDLKPREILRCCPGEFSSEDEIYQLKCDIFVRVLRNIDQIRKFMSTDEKPSIKEEST